MHGNGQILSGYYSVKFTSNTSSVLHRVGSPNNENRTGGEMVTRIIQDKIFICDWKYRVRLDRQMQQTRRALYDDMKI